MTTHRDEAQPEQWAIVEIMGHRKMAGRVSEVQKFGATLLQIDMPLDGDEWLTQLYPGSSLFCVTPVTEQVARAVAAKQQTPTMYALGLTSIQSLLEPRKPVLHVDDLPFDTSESPSEDEPVDDDSYDGDDDVYPESFIQHRGY